MASAMLPDWKLRKEILIEPFNEESLQPAGYEIGKSVV